jgi:hypothetical protein
MYTAPLAGIKSVCRSTHYTRHAGCVRAARRVLQPAPGRNEMLTARLKEVRMKAPDNLVFCNHAVYVSPLSTSNGR